MVVLYPSIIRCVNAASGACERRHEGMRRLVPCPSPHESAQRLGASPGAATGAVVFDADAAVRLSAGGAKVLLVRPRTSPEDVHGMVGSAGVLTGNGGVTSHAAVVARGMGKPCVVGAQSLKINSEEGFLACGDAVVAEGCQISIDGDSGEIFLGEVATVQPEASNEGEMATLLSWADARRRLGVWANADTPDDAALSRDFGAEGIGLCRTEHMFFDPERLSVVQGLILAAHASKGAPERDASRRKYATALGKLERLQTVDFEGIFRAMSGRPVVIRLLDPPLHEFLPSRDELAIEVARLESAGVGAAKLSEKKALLETLDEMHELNPMLGLRGCRVGLMYPEIYEMQTRAVLRAASNVAREGVVARPEIMVPFVNHGNEMRQVRDRLKAVVERIREEQGSAIACPIGAMIETPRAALCADTIARTAEFFSFGTNDLTQTTFALSRDDAERKFLGGYLEDKLLEANPFQVVDRDGVGQLVRMAGELGRSVRPDIVLGICGEHGGDPSSIEFFHEVNLDYGSCSPYRVPVARLAAAQAAIRSGGDRAARPEVPVLVRRNGHHVERAPRAS